MEIPAQPEKERCKIAKKWSYILDDGSVAILSEETRVYHDWEHSAFRGTSLHRTEKGAWIIEHLSAVDGETDSADRVQPIDALRYLLARDKLDWALEYPDLAACLPDAQA